MTRIRVAHLVGWIQVMPRGDGYGVPLFKGRGNAPLTPETDDDLTITRFHEFYNEAGHQVSGQLPEGHGGRRYRVGDKVPIPFTVGGQAGIVDAGTPRQAFLDAYSRCADSPAVRGVADILGAVADGEYRRASVERMARRLRLEHDEVLAGEPVHSSYWLQKLETAAANLRRMPDEYRAVEREVVSERAGAWLRRFASKSDFQLLGRLLRIVEKARFDPSRELRDQVFGTILTRLGEHSRPAKEHLRLLAAAKAWMPGGLHNYYLEHGLPEGLPQRDRDRAVDLPRFLWDVMQEDDRRGGTFDRSLAIASAIFSDGDLPIDISGTIGHMALNRANALGASMSAIYDRRGGTYYRYDLSRSEATDMLAENDRVISLYRILHGEDRLAYEPAGNKVRYGLSPYDVADLKSRVEQGSVADGLTPSGSQSGRRRKGRRA